MTPAAQRAQLDFVRLSGEEPSSLYFERFLRDGFASWPTDYQRRFAGLKSWGGVTALKQSLRWLAGAPQDGQTVLASRSLSLVRFAAERLFRTCRHLLTTDLSWPTYQRALDRRAARTDRGITTTPIREHILRHGWTAADVVDHLARIFAAEQCDGLFLPAVDHLGIRVPVREIVERIECVSDLRFCLVDAAQAFCHVPLAESAACADFVIAGSHKWMGAYLPMGIGFAGRRRSQGMIRRGLLRFQKRGGSDDPLLKFTENLEGGALDGYSETANLAPLFASAGAAMDQLSTAASELRCEYELDRASIDVLPRPTQDWQPLRRDASLSSRIVLFETRLSRRQVDEPDTVRRLWLDAGLVVSAYPNGLVRLSVPPGGIQALRHDHDGLQLNRHSVS